MEIRKANLQDFAALRRIYAAARQFMRDHGNPNQWGNTSPEEELLLRDIRRGHLYLVTARPVEKAGTVPGDEKTASEPVPEPSAKEQEKLRIAREVKAARDKMELLDKVRGKLLNRLLVLRREYPDLSNQSGSNQIKELSAQVDWLDDQLRDARLAYAETRAASLQALKELGQ